MSIATPESTTATGPRRDRKRLLRRWLLVLGGIAVIGAGVAIWESGFKYRFIPKRWGTVKAGQIYRSGQLSRWVVEKTLARHRISVIVDMCTEQPHDLDQRAELAAAEKLQIDHLWFPLAGDGTGDIHEYAGALKALTEAVAADRPVLVHCAAGADRTGGVIAGYRMLIQHRSPEEAYAEMLSYGWDPRRNRKLVDYLNSHMSELVDLLVENGTLTERPAEIPVVGPVRRTRPL
ncbi:MAG TPA: tyrosine-protein phosphatase [Planctomycetaceae bacterium]|nr:tyrosine-protein phosphatase [Planctomycetaceae bacterium]